MNAFAADPFAPTPAAAVNVDIYTTAYRISGTITSRFTRVADILNQASSTHLVLEHATVSEYDAPGATLGAQQVHVPLDEILILVAQTAGAASPDMRIPKRGVRAQLGVPPFRLTGTVHIPQGSRPVDGLLNAADRFLPMTDVTIACAAHAELERSIGALAVQRRRAQVILVADDERPDALLADVLDERTAQAWLQARDVAPES
jgi:Family of unknown function (DUF6812)